jgi:hypothetical protein
VEVGHEESLVNVDWRSVFRSAKVSMMLKSAGIMIQNAVFGGDLMGVLVSLFVYFPSLTKLVLN